MFKHFKIPNEIALKIFSYFSPGKLLEVSTVDSEFLLFSQTRNLWCDHLRHLHIPDNILKDEVFQSFSGSQLKVIYFRLKARIPPLLCQELCMLDIVLLLSDMEVWKNFAEKSSLIIDKELLYKAAKFASLDLIKQIVEVSGASPDRESFSIAVSYNTVTVVEYLAEKIDYEFDTLTLNEALTTDNFKLADYLIDTKQLQTNSIFIQVLLSKDRVTTIDYLVTKKEPITLQTLREYKNLLSRAPQCQELLLKINFFSDSEQSNCCLRRI